MGRGSARPQLERVWNTGYIDNSFPDPGGTSQATTSVMTKSAGENKNESFRDCPANPEPAIDEQNCHDGLGMTAPRPWTYSHPSPSAVNA